MLDRLGRLVETRIFSEDGIYEITMLSSTEKAREFRAWIRKLLKALRKEEYEIIPITEYQRMIAESRLLNAQVRKAREYENLAALYRGTEYAKILDSYASEVLAGKPLIPLPELPERTYTATEIGKKLGISAKRVGMLTNEHDLKTKEYGMWFRDVALHRQDMEVPVFRYFENIIPVLKELL